METIYRCMTCGNNLPADGDKAPKCNYCSEETIMTAVTEENKDSLIPSNPYIPDTPKDE